MQNSSRYISVFLFGYDEVVTNKELTLQKKKHINYYEGRTLPDLHKLSDIWLAFHYSPHDQTLLSITFKRLKENQITTYPFCLRVHSCMSTFLPSKPQTFPLLPLRPLCGTQGHIHKSSECFQRQLQTDSCSFHTLRKCLRTCSISDALYLYP